MPYGKETEATVGKISNGKGMTDGISLTVAPMFPQAIEFQFSMWTDRSNPIA